MSRKSLGIIETFGLAAGVEAADAAVKSANVRLVGCENSKGSGRMTIKIEGDVGAVKSAVAAAVAAVSRMGKVVGTTVIPRPVDALEDMIENHNVISNFPKGGDCIPASATPIARRPKKVEAPVEEVPAPAAVEAEVTEVVEEPVVEAPVVEEPVVEEPVVEETVEEPVKEKPKAPTPPPVKKMPKAPTPPPAKDEE